MTSEHIANEIESYIDQAFLIAKSREYGKNVLRVYYIDGNLCVDVINKQMSNYIIELDIKTETFSVTDAKRTSLEMGLLSIKSLKRIFEIYILIRGKNDYYNECFDKSCIRYLVDKNLVSY